MAFSQLVVALVISWLTHRVYLIVYRLYFHRLAKFPGPRLAAISTLYRAFYQIWKDGKLIEHATELHDLYDIVNDFIFGDLPHKFRQLKNETFLEPLAVGTYDAMNWWIWLSRNYPTLLSLIQKMPSSWLQSMTQAFEAPKIVVELVTSMVDDALTVRPKDWHERFFYCIVHGLEGQNRNGSESANVPSSVLVEEVMGTMLGGVIDIANILPYGAFQLSQSPQLQDRLYEELRGAWTNITDPIPDYETLCTLPLLNGLVKESVRLTHGVISGPPRAVGPLGAVIDGYSVPPKPETFDPLRWVTGNPKQMENAIVAFSKGRRMCPAKHLAYMEMFSIFAMLFRRFQVSSYETE
ncbi:hypothetical protein APSETT444_000252 [Aspergillus pseudonomiae]